MRVRYSFSSRHTRRARDRTASESKEKFPDLLKEVIQNSDIILEVLDARFPKETHNSEIENFIFKKNKQIIYVLHKSDLISKKTNPDLPLFVYTSAKKRQGIKTLRNLIKRISGKVKNPVKKDKISVGVIGYPNTGKSSLINILIGKSSAGTGHEAGFTKGIQKLKLTNKIILLDSPGVIPEKEYLSSENSKFAKVSARSYTQVKDPEIAVANLMIEYPNVFEKFYNISVVGNSEELIEKLGKRKRFLKKGGIVDEDRTARAILKDWQQGKIQV